MTSFARSAVRLAGVLAVLAAGPAARGDQIDRALVRDAAGVAKAVRGLGAKSVAVLKFQVQVGTAAPTFGAGTLGTDMVNRLENVLILTADPKAADGVIEVLTGAGAEAAKKARDAREAFDWTTPAGRAKLFGMELPVAWDAGRKAAPDGFVTGTVRLAADLKTLSVELVGFTRGDPSALRSLRTVGGGETAVLTDRGVLTSLGRSFNVPRRVATARGTNNNIIVEAVAVEDAADRKGVAPAAGPGPVKFQIFYGKTEVEPKPNPDAPGELKVPSPLPGQRVRFFLTNVGKDPVAVLLTVNGRNTVALDGTNEDLAAPTARRDNFHMWVLEERNKLYEIGGFLKNVDGTVAPFAVLPEAASEAAYNALAPAHAGKFQMTVFGKKPEVVPATPDEPPTLKGTLPKFTKPQPATKPDPEKDDPPVVVEPIPVPRDDAKADGPKLVHPDDATVRGLDEGTDAGALVVVKNVQASRSLADAQQAIVKGTRLARTADGGLTFKPKKRGLLGADESRDKGNATEQIPFDHDPSPIANVVVSYYAPKPPAR